MLKRKAILARKAKIKAIKLLSTKDFVMINRTGEAKRAIETLFGSVIVLSCK